MLIPVRTLRAIAIKLFEGLMLISCGTFTMLGKLEANFVNALI